MLEQSAPSSRTLIQFGFHTAQGETKLATHARTSVETEFPLSKEKAWRAQVQLTCPTCKVIISRGMAFLCLLAHQMPALCML